MEDLVKADINYILTNMVRCNVYVCTAIKTFSKIGNETVL